MSREPSPPVDLGAFYRRLWEDNPDALTASAVVLQPDVEPPVKGE